MADRPLRITFIGHSAERTGPPIFLLGFLRWLVEHTDAEPTVVLGRGGELENAYRDVCPVTLVGLGKDQVPMELAVSAANRLAGADKGAKVRRQAVGRALRNHKNHDLLYLNGATAPGVEMVRAMPSLGKLITHVHELSMGFGGGLAEEPRELLLAGSHHFIAASAAVARMLGDHGVADERIGLHHEFIDAPAPPDDEARTRAREMLGIAGDCQVVGSVGIRTWRKAPDLFLRLAWNLTRSGQRPDVRFVWLGGKDTDPETARLRYEISRMGLTDQVQLVEAVAKPSELVAAFDVFALPAREDAFPLACLEAGALGVPTVCFDTGGIQEFVRDDAGIVVQYPDLDAMTTAIAGLLDDRARRDQAGAVAAARVRELHQVEVAAPQLWLTLRRLAA